MRVIAICRPCYNSTKAAVTHLGKSLAREWREFARVNIVSPGFVKTDMGAAPQVLSEAYRMSVMGRQADPRELKGAYLYLASDASTCECCSPLRALVSEHMTDLRALIPLCPRQTRRART